MRIWKVCEECNGKLITGNNIFTAGIFFCDKCKIMFSPYEDKDYEEVICDACAGTGKGLALKKEFRKEAEVKEDGR
jgi:hypothetical protein